MGLGPHERAAQQSSFAGIEDDVAHLARAERHHGNAIVVHAGNPTGSHLAAPPVMAVGVKRTFDITPKSKLVAENEDNVPSVHVCSSMGGCVVLGPG
jgi:hypothetical protein